MTYAEIASQRIASIEVVHMVGGPTTYHVEYVNPKSNKRIMRDTNLTIGAQEFLCRRKPVYRRNVCDHEGNIVKNVSLYVR